MFRTPSVGIQGSINFKCAVEVFICKLYTRKHVLKHLGIGTYIKHFIAQQIVEESSSVVQYQSVLII